MIVDVCVENPDRIAQMTTLENDVQEFGISILQKTRFDCESVAVVRSISTSHEFSILLRHGLRELIITNKERLSATWDIP